MNSTQRYARQIILPEIGETGQRRLSGSSVLCIGAGGLGSPALLYLAAAGVGHIGVMDFDHVDESNLQRQILFSSDTLGQPKALAAQKKLLSLNPNIRVTAHNERLEASRAHLFGDYDIILDGTDNFAAKFLINDAAVKYGKPWVYGAIQGFDGQACVFDPPQGSCYRCLHPEMPKAQIANCAESGVIGAVAGIVGTTQALQVIQLITGHTHFAPLIGKLWTIDTRTMMTHTLALPRNPFCPVCSRSKEDIILKNASSVCRFISDITPQQAKDMKDALIIDVREQDEWDGGHIAEAQHLPLSKLAMGRLPECARDQNIILHCQKGVRSLQAAHILMDEGYLYVYNLSGGYEEWLKQNPSCPQNVTKA